MNKRTLRDTTDGLLRSIPTLPTQHVDLPTHQTLHTHRLHQIQCLRRRVATAALAVDNFVCALEIIIEECTDNLLLVQLRRVPIVEKSAEDLLVPPVDLRGDGTAIDTNQLLGDDCLAFFD